MKQDHPIKIVVADDSPRVRQHLVSMIANIGHEAEISEADNGLEAVEQVERLQPQVVVLDIQMPGTNGLAALRRIKHRYPDMLVIMLTNHADAYYRDICLQAGANFFFDKTIEFEKIRDVIRQLPHGTA